MPFTKNKSKETREEYLERKKLERKRAAELRKKLLEERLEKLKANPLYQTRYSRDVAYAPLTVDDLELIKELSMYHADEVTIAHSLNFRYEDWLTLKEQFPIVQKKIDEGRAAGKAIIYRLQFQGAVEGNTALLMYLGRHVLGYGKDEAQALPARPQALPELSEEARQHLAELAQAICDAAQPREEKPANAQVVENVITPDFKASPN